MVRQIDYNMICSINTYVISYIRPRSGCSIDTCDTRPVYVSNHVDSRGCMSIGHTTRSMMQLHKYINTLIKAELNKYTE